jgi:hypothetical protein
MANLGPAGLDCVFTDADIGDSFPDDHMRDSKEIRLTHREIVRTKVVHMTERWGRVSKAEKEEWH